jgi:hypothetical protein
MPLPISTLPLVGLLVDQMATGALGSLAGQVLLAANGPVQGVPTFNGSPQAASNVMLAGLTN